VGSYIDERKTPVMQHDYVQPLGFKYKRVEVKDMQMQKMMLGKVFARQDCSYCVARTTGLRLPRWLVFLLRRAFAGSFRGYEDRGAACSIRAFVHYEDGLAAFVLRSA